MTIKELNLLEIEVYDENNLIYRGMSENAPADLKEKQIQISKIENKKLIINLVKQ